MKTLFAPRMESRDIDSDVYDRFFRGDDERGTAAGVRVGTSNATRVITALRCVKLLCDVISTLPKDTVVSIGPSRFVEFERPTWLTRPDPDDENLTDVEHFSQIVSAMALAGHSYTYAPGGISPTSGYPDGAPLIVLDPRMVRGCRPPFEILDERGRVTKTVYSDRMLHVSWLRKAGQKTCLSPIEEARQSIGIALSEEEFAARFFGKGASLAFGVEVPGPMTTAQREDLAESLRESYAGIKRSHSIGILGGGAKFVTGLGVTNDQAQFLESRKFSKEEIATLFGVPPHLVGSQEPGASSYNSVEQRSLEFGKFNVAPWVDRITRVYSRLTAVPLRLEGSNARASFQMDLRGLERADIKTRYEAYGIGLDKGFIKPDEARALEDLPPVPGGDVTYHQSQMVPLGTPQENAA